MQFLTLYNTYHSTYCNWSCTHQWLISLTLPMEFYPCDVHFHYFNHIHSLPLERTEEDRIPKYGCVPTAQNIIFWTIIYPFKAEDIIYCYSSSYLKDFQLHSNLLIQKTPHKPLIKYLLSDYYFQYF